MKKLIVSLLLLIVATPIMAVGENVWELQFGNSGNNDGATVRGIVTDSSGNVFITGNFTGTVDFGGTDLVNIDSPGADIFVAKYNSSGVHQWSVAFESTGTSSDDLSWGIGLTAAGNPVIAGNFNNTINFGGGSLISAGSSDIFVAELSRVDGSYVNAVRFGGTGRDQALAIKVESGGNVDITGSYGYFGSAPNFGGGILPTNGSAGDIFITKLDSTFAHIWSKSITATSGDAGQGIGTDTAGNVYVTGFYLGSFVTGSCVTYNSGGFRNLFIAKYSAVGGGLAWFKSYGGSGDDQGNGITVDGSGNFVIIGTFQDFASFGGATLGTAGTNSADILLAKYDTNGVHQWSKSFGSISGFAEAGSGVAVDGSGNIAIVGMHINPINFGGSTLPGNTDYNFYVAKFNSSGTHIWSAEYPAAGASYNEYGFAITFNSSDSIIAGGSFQEKINFGLGVMTVPRPPNFIFNGCLAKFNP